MKKIAVIVLITVVGSFLWYRHALTPLDASSETRRSVAVEQGMSLEEISDVLEEKRVIRSPLALRIRAQLSGVGSKLQHGTFVLRQSMSVDDVLETLQSGKAEEALVTIPEGFTVLQVDALLAEKGLSEDGAIITCANECAFEEFGFLPPAEGLAQRGGRIEGYLFPDTYFVAATSFSTKQFLARMLSTFRTKVVDVHGADVAQSGRSLHEIVTMASLIEEEALGDEERPVIAGILWKRFDDGRGLEVDAAVRYILDKPTAAITRSDLNTDSPYNIRKFRGLPPGPIANPGLKSIEAALNPKESPYWYYLHGNDGQIRYAETNEEHNVNRYQYLR